jgi:hypothetical protein
MERVVRMRAEDRKPSKRVFPLLQNLDLDTVTFDQIQSTGNPITIQDMNEQEMLDLIIVNLARLCTVSEWTGLLEAGGGFSPSTPSGVSGAVYPLTPVGTPTNMQSHDLLTGTIFATPFVCPAGGLSLSTDTSVGCTINILVAGASSTVLVGIYDADSGNSPQTKLATATFDVSTTGVKTNAWDTAVDLTAGQLYWVAHLRPNGETGTISVDSIRDIYCPMIGWTTAAFEFTNVAHDTGSQTTLPATWSAASNAYDRNIVVIGVPV